MPQLSCLRTPRHRDLRSSLGLAWRPEDRHCPPVPAIAQWPGSLLQPRPACAWGIPSSPCPPHQVSGGEGGGGMCKVHEMLLAFHITASLQLAASAPLRFSHVWMEVVKFQVNTRVLVHSLGT